MQSEFRVETYTVGGAITLALSGELDLVSCPALQRKMDRLAHSEAELIVLDLRGLEFMDSTGLHLVLRAQQQAHDSGRRFAVVRGPEHVQRLFDMTGVAEALTFADSPEQLFAVDPAPAPGAPGSAR